MCVPALRDDVEGAACIGPRKSRAHEAAKRDFGRVHQRRCYGLARTTRWRPDPDDAVRLSSTKVHGARDVLFAEDLLRVEPIVGATANAQVRGLVCAAERA